MSAECSLNQTRRRLDHCLSHHSECKPGAVSGGSQKIVPLRFLNVNPVDSGAKVTLVQAEPDDFEPYVILSYVWGQDQTIKT